jgi:hypothetical protein
MLPEVDPVDPTAVVLTRELLPVRLKPDATTTITKRDGADDESS